MYNFGLFDLWEYFLYKKPNYWLDQRNRKLFEGLGSVFRKNVNLKEIRLGDNLLGDAGVNALVPSLRSNKTLTLLDISFNKIGSNGAIALGNILAANEGLETLNASDNHFNDNGTKEIARSLKVTMQIWIIVSDALQKFDFRLSSEIAKKVAILRSDDAMKTSKECSFIESGKIQTICISIY